MIMVSDITSHCTGSVHNYGKAGAHR